MQSFVECKVSLADGTCGVTHASLNWLDKQTDKSTKFTSAIFVDSQRWMTDLITFQIFLIILYAPQSVCEMTTPLSVFWFLACVWGLLLADRDSGWPWQVRDTNSYVLLLIRRHVTASISSPWRHLEDTWKLGEERCCALCSTWLATSIQANLSNSTRWECCCCLPGWPHYSRSG